jgi:D-cysteine desulfhydrase
MTPLRHPLATLPTPLVRAQGLERALTHGPIYIKRDDLTGFATAGNKARALEYLISDALARGADLLVVAGSPSSNFCAAAAVAAGTVGLECDVLLCGPRPSGPAVNVELARSAGARLLFDAVASRDELDEAVVVHAAQLRTSGRRPYPLPRGGATAIGALGYAYAAREVAEQCENAEIDPRTIVVATGSGATQAGLITGTVGFGLRWQVVGASASRPGGDAAKCILQIALDCAGELGVVAPTADDVDVRDVRGAGFGIAAAEDRLSAKLALTHEALLLDDYYGAKSMTLFRALLDAGAPTPAIFWHTGGMVAALAALSQGAQA